MTDELNRQLDKLKAQVAEWPIEQKASHIGGIFDGLRLAILIAKESGCNLGKDNYLNELVNHLGGQKYPPVKRRNEATQNPKPARNQLGDDIKVLLRRAIASRLQISKETFDASLDADDTVNKCLLTVIAIANRSALDDAIQDIQIMRSIAGGGDVDRASVKSEVETCHEKFPIEIAAIKRFNEYSKRSNFKLKDIWSHLRSNVRLDSRYDDDELRAIDARYQSTNIQP